MVRDVVALLRGPTTTPRTYDYFPDHGDQMGGMEAGPAARGERKPDGRVAARREDGGAWRERKRDGRREDGDGRHAGAARRRGLAGRGQAGGRGARGRGQAARGAKARTGGRTAGARPAGGAGARGGRGRRETHAGGARS